MLIQVSRFFCRGRGSLIWLKPQPGNSCTIRGTNPGGWGHILTYYRLYLLSQSGDHFIGFEELEAEDDVEAARLAEAQRGIHPLELWCGKRRVKSFPAKGVKKA